MPSTEDLTYPWGLPLVTPETHRACLLRVSGGLIKMLESGVQRHLRNPSSVRIHPEAELPAGSAHCHGWVHLHCPTRHTFLCFLHGANLSQGHWVVGVAAAGPIEGHRVKLPPHTGWFHYDPQTEGRLVTLSVTVEGTLPCMCSTGWQSGRTAVDARHPRDTPPPCAHLRATPGVPSCHEQ